MDYKVELLDRPVQPALIIRKRAPVFRLQKVLGEAFEALEKRLAELGEQAAGAPFVAYHNMNMFSLDMEIGFPVKKKLPGNGAVEAGEFPGGKAASCLFVGPYGKIQPVYKALQSWIKSNRYTATGVAYEVYLNDPGNTPPAELQTQVVFPLK
jgi:effector-binding domain-containing protein